MFSYQSREESGMEETDPLLKQTLSLIIESGYQVDARALTFLKSIVNTIEIKDIIKGVIEELTASPDKPVLISEEFLKSRITKLLQTSEQPTFTENTGVFKPCATDIKSKIEVLYNPADHVDFDGSIQVHLKYFKDRLTKIEKILRERMDVKDAILVSEALKRPLRSRTKIIGIVTEKKERKNSVFIRIEDCYANILVFISHKSDKNLINKYARLFIDQVVCIEATKIKDDLFVANDLISPDIPDRKTNVSSEQVYAVLTSDLHIGSKKFLKISFDRFINWLKGKEGSNLHKEIANKVKYLIIAGDIVDGIGVYPNQEKELDITNIYEQYEVASKLIKEIPESIEIIIIPGNHDATRQALPQPAILRKYAKPLYDLKNVTMLGDPAKIRLHGVEFLLYHGRSLDDIIGAAPDVTYLHLEQEITIAMKYLLKTRHVAPIFGSKTPIAPMPVDNLVIDSPPDVLHAGHVHVFGYENYRGTLLVNSGAWQEQTEYQKKMGLIPTPGIVPIIDLKNMTVLPINFLSST